MHCVFVRQAMLDLVPVLVASVLNPIVHTMILNILKVKGGRDEEKITNADTDSKKVLGQVR